MEMNILQTQEWTALHRLLFQQAFMIYTAPLVSAHPSAILELLAYNLTIIKASQQYDGLLWRSYDVYPSAPSSASSPEFSYSALQEAEAVPQDVGFGHMCRLQC